MSAQPTSIRRRQVLIAGAVSAAAPAVAFADANGVRPLIEGPIVVSGRVVDSAGRPLAGASVAVDAGSGITATTDGDGRFFVSGHARAASVDVHVRDARRRSLTRNELQRDESGVWRTTVGISLA